MITLYDIITNRLIHFAKHQVMKKSSELRIDYTCIYKLLDGSMSHISARYILPHNRDKIFTLINFDTNEEYPCIANRTIFTHLQLPYNENISKYLTDLRKQKQRMVSIGGSVFYLKGFPPTRKAQTLKAESPKLKEIQQIQQLKHKITSRLRVRIGAAIRSQKANKHAHTQDLLGCHIRFFMGYIECLFTKGMSWENYGKWHIDHIKPCESFDLLSPREQAICFHYSNLRPLWATTDVALKFGEVNYEGNLNRKKTV